MVICKEFAVLCELSLYCLVYIQRCLEMHTFSEVGSDSVVTTWWTVHGSNSLGGDIFRTSPARPWTLSGLLYVKCVQGPSPAGKRRPGLCVDHPHASSAEVKGREELCTYFPSGLHSLFYDDLYVYLTYSISSVNVYHATRQPLLSDVSVSPH
jgi:hypothetical protein